MALTPEQRQAVIAELKNRGEDTSIYETQSQTQGMQTQMPPQIRQGLAAKAEDQIMNPTPIKLSPSSRFAPKWEAPKERPTPEVLKAEAAADAQAKFDLESVKENMNHSSIGREMMRRAKQNIEIIEKLEARGIDPSIYTTPNQLDMHKLQASLGRGASKEIVSDVELLNKNSVYLMSDMVKSMGGRPNQYVEQLLLSALPGSAVANRSGLKLSTELYDTGAQKTFEGPFQQQYLAKNGTTMGWEEAFQHWVDTTPALKKADNKKGFDYTDIRELEKSWKGFTYPTDDPRFIEARVTAINKKPNELKTDEDLDYLAEHGE